MMWELGYRLYGQKGAEMLVYYKVERDRSKRYIISLYYRNFIGAMSEMHRSAHRSPKEVNEVVQKYRTDGYRVQSIMTA